MLTAKYYWHNSKGVTDIKELNDDHLDNIISMLQKREVALKEKAESERIRSNYNYSDKKQNLDKEHSKISSMKKVLKKERARRLNDKIQSKSSDGKHNSTMSSEQRRMVTLSLMHTFGYKSSHIVKLTDPEVYDLWKQQLIPIQL